MFLLLLPRKTQSQSLNNHVLPITQSTYYCSASLLLRILFKDAHLFVIVFKILDLAMIFAEAAGL